MSNGFSAFFLEMLNGGAITPELLWLVLIGIYLSREATRRDKHWFDFFHLPEAMDFMVAVFIADAGVCLRSLIIWNWRRTGAGEFNEAEMVGLIVGGALIVLGFLCKIRSFSEPSYGRRPWLAAAGLTALVLIAMLVFR